MKKQVWLSVGPRVPDVLRTARDPGVKVTGKLLASTTLTAAGSYHLHICTFSVPSVVPVLFV